MMTTHQNQDAKYGTMCLSMNSFHQSNRPNVCSYLRSYYCCSHSRRATCIEHPANCLCRTLAEGEPWCLAIAWSPISSDHQDTSPHVTFLQSACHGTPLVHASRIAR
jgi:hypothetical protein